MNKFFLLKLKATRDPELFAQFYDAYIDKVYRFIFFKVSVPEDVNDLTSDVFLKVWQYLHEGKAVKNLNALVYCTARNIVVDYYRRKSRQDIKGLENFEHIVDTDKADIENQVDMNLEMQELYKLLAVLKDDYRDVLLLKYVEDYSLKEISAIMEKNVGATKVLLHRAKKRLLEVRDKKREDIK